MTLFSDKDKALSRLIFDLSGTEVKPTECLRHKAEASVFLAQYRGQRVILKQFHKDGADRLRRMQAELDAVTHLMSGTPHRINRFLEGFPEFGIAVLEHAGEIRLAQAFAENGASRAPMMAQAADWLAAYVGPRRRTEPFRPRRWLKKTFDAAKPLSVAQSNAKAVLQGMARRLAGAEFTRAATHGDFVSINAMWDKGQIVGVDVQGEAWLPLARDMARFLVWQEMTDPAPGPRTWGIANCDLHPFLEAPLIPRPEAETVLPFFIGLQFVQLLWDLQSRPKAVAAREAALAKWCTQM